MAEPDRGEQQSVSVLRDPSTSLKTGHLWHFADLDQASLVFAASSPRRRSMVVSTTGNKQYETERKGPLIMSVVRRGSRLAVEVAAR